MESFYIDHNATTPMHPEAIEAMASVQREWFGNASSVHSCGSDARTVLEGARRRIAGMIGCKPKELYFTSGGTEANNWALCGSLEKHPSWGVIPSAIEHKSVLNAAWAYCPVVTDQDGILELDDLESVMKKIGHDSLVSVMLANNETGVIQPVREIVDVVKRLRPDSLVHTDAVQMFGKHPVNVEQLGVDLMTISAHKVGGPKGIGALYVREGVEIEPLIRGGHQERDRRAGTENVAARLRQENLRQYTAAVYEHTSTLERRLSHALGNVWINGGGAQRIPNTLNMGFGGVDSEALVLMLSGQGVMVSNGSACEAGSLDGSHVLKAMGQSEEDSRSAIRFSFSDDLPDGAMDLIVGRVIESVDSLRGMSVVPL